MDEDRNVGRVLRSLGIIPLGMVRMAFGRNLADLS